MKIITLYSIYLAVPESDFITLQHSGKKIRFLFKTANSLVVNISFHISRRSFDDRTDCPSMFPTTLLHDLGLGGSREMGSHDTWNKQWRTGKRGWSSTLEFKEKHRNTSPQRICCEILRGFSNIDSFYFGTKSLGDVNRILFAQEQWRSLYI
jgi:hypothetical protein